MTEELRSPSFWELIRTRNFGLLWGAGGLSAIADQFDLIAFPWLVLLVTGDPLAVGVVISVGSIPAVFFMLLGGSLADRYNPRLIMLFSNAIRIVLVSTLAVLALTDLADLWLIYLFSLLKGMADSFYYPSHLAILPRVVPIGLLRQSNAVVHTTSELSGFIGPALAGSLIAFFNNGGPTGSGSDKTGIGIVFAVVAVVLLVSSLLLIFLRTERSTTGSEVTDESSVLSSIAQGIRHVRNDGSMLAVFILIAGIELLIEGPVVVGIPVLSDMRFAEGAFALGVIASSYAGGTVLGAVLAGTLPAPGRRTGPILIAFFALCGILVMPFGFLTSMWHAVCIALAVGVLGGYIDIIITSWLQARTPQAMLGRVMSLLTVSMIGLSPISFAVSGALMRLSLGWVFMVAGGLMAVFSIVVGLRREIRRMGE